MLRRADQRLCVVGKEGALCQLQKPRLAEICFHDFFTIIYIQPIFLQNDRALSLGQRLVLGQDPPFGRPKIFLRLFLCGKIEFRRQLCQLVGLKNAIQRFLVGLLDGKITKVGLRLGYDGSQLLAQIGGLPSVFHLRFQRTLQILHVGKHVVQISVLVQ